MLFILFAIMAIITIYVAVKLSKYADIISQRTAFGGMFFGSILLALATSLPEVTTSATSIIIANPDLAVGNLLGSNLFNMFIIACFDIYFRRLKIFQSVPFQLRYHALLGIVLTIIVFFGLFFHYDVTILGIGIESIVMLLVYGLGMLVISKSTPPLDEQSSITSTTADMAQNTLKKPDNTGTYHVNVRQALFRFVIYSIIILIAGSVLTITGDRIAVITGIGSSFVGSFLIAATTSLPEAVSVYVAILLINYRLAVGTVLGSNLFNLLFLAGTDVFFREGSLLTHSADTHQITAFSGIVLIGIGLYALVRHPKKARFYLWPSAAIVLTYFIITYITFFAS